MSEPVNRRPLASRQTGWARKLSAALARSAVTPNQISAASVLFAMGGAVLLLWWPTAIGLVVCAACIQLRLLCNLLDGMVAVEGGKQSTLGVLYNEFPDRIADSLFIAAAGYAVGHPWLGWLGALLAALTAYIRVTGGSPGLLQDFRGPMAKPHRMATLTVGCLLAAGEWWWNGTRHALLIALALIAAGSAWTCIARTQVLAALLRARS